MIQVIRHDLVLWACRYVCACAGVAPPVGGWPPEAGPTTPCSTEVAPRCQARSPKTKAHRKLCYWRQQVLLDCRRRGQSTLRRCAQQRPRCAHHVSQPAVGGRRAKRVIPEVLTVLCFNPFSTGHVCSERIAEWQLLDPTAELCPVQPHACCGVVWPLPSRNQGREGVVGGRGRQNVPRRHSSRASAQIGSVL